MTQATGNERASFTHTSLPSLLPLPSLAYSFFSPFYLPFPSPLPFLFPYFITPILFLFNLLFSPYLLTPLLFLLTLPFPHMLPFPFHFPLPVLKSQERLDLSRCRRFFSLLLVFHLNLFINCFPVDGDLRKKNNIWKRA